MLSQRGEDTGAYTPTRWIRLPVFAMPSDYKCTSFDRIGPGILCVASDLIWVRLLGRYRGRLVSGMIKAFGGHFYVFSKWLALMVLCCLSVKVLLRPILVVGWIYIGRCDDLYRFVR